MASSIDKTLEVPALKIQKMLEVADIIQMAQRAKPKEFLAIKAGLDAAFGQDWRDFKLSDVSVDKEESAMQHCKCDSEAHKHPNKKCEKPSVTREGYCQDCVGVMAL